MRSVCEHGLDALRDLVGVELPLFVAQRRDVGGQPDVGGVLQSIACEAFDLALVLLIDTTAQRVALGLGRAFLQPMSLGFGSQLADL